MSRADVDGTADAAEVDDDINAEEHSPESVGALYCRPDGANPSVCCSDSFRFSFVGMGNITIEIMSILAETTYGCSFQDFIIQHWKGY